MHAWRVGYVIDKKSGLSCGSTREKHRRPPESNVDPRNPQPSRSCFWMPLIRAGGNDPHVTASCVAPTIGGDGTHQSIRFKHNNIRRTIKCPTPEHSVANVRVMETSHRNLPPERVARRYLTGSNPKRILGILELGSRVMDRQSLTKPLLMRTLEFE